MASPSVDRRTSEYTPKQVAGQHRNAFHRLTLAVLIGGLAVTGVLTAVSRLNYLNAEQRLTKLQVELTGSALGAAPIDLERRIGEALSAASQASDPAAAFRSAIAGSMAPVGPFATAALVRVVDGAPQEITLLGAKPLLSPGSSQSRAIVDRAANTSALVTTRVVAAGQQRLGFLMSATSAAGRLVASASEVLPFDHRITVPASSPDAGDNFAIYWGATTKPSELVETNTSTPLTGTVSSVLVPFGDNVLNLVISPRGSLAGAWSESVAWGILAIGVLFTLAIAAMTERLLRRQELAELLAGENRSLYQQQRRVAETLQHSLLPQVLPRREELEIAVRYLPGTADLDVGGDWYDLVEVGERQVFFTVGDVAGRGLEAAALMSTLRNSITAFASDGVEPSDVLDKVGRLVDAGRDGRFATALCGVLDLSSGELVLANAGHPELLLIRDGNAEYVPTAVGPPIGVARRSYVATRLRLEPGSVLLAFTDGLIERRDAPLSAGLEHLRQAAVRDVALPSLLDDVLAALVPAGAPDDVALLGIRWKG